ncbi:MAG: tRNA uridine-5-carboxymethylaminomethyl(34) synthesis GTPase MnmE [Candidatus Tumulicola sp.]
MRADDDTIAAIATPPGKGAIAIVRISGRSVRDLCTRLVRSKEALEPRVATRATVLDETGRPLDRGIALLFSAPASYTGEDLLELQVHGSPVVAREIVRALIACGVRPADPGEFTRRAFLNGKMDLHEAEAIADVIDAESRSAARAALANLGGGLAAEVRMLRSALAGVLEELAAAIDFPDEVPEPDPARLDAALAPIVANLERLRADGERGRLVREGLTAAIVGPPNAGKSSLLNALLGEDRAIVSEIAGTTRDSIEESVAIRGVRVRLVDTAGIREHADRLEAAGIERTQRALASARIAIVVIDGSAPLGTESRHLLAATRNRMRVIFFNKADLGDAGAREFGDSAAIIGSTWNPVSLGAVRDAVAHVGWGGESPDLERPHLAALREFAAVGEALEALTDARKTLAGGEPTDFIAGDLERAFSALGHVSERVAAEEVLDGIFARFCIGK